MSAEKEMYELRTVKALRKLLEGTGITAEKVLETLQIDPNKNYVPNGTYVDDIDLFAAKDERFYLGEHGLTYDGGKQKAEFLKTQSRLPICRSQAKINAQQMLVGALHSDYEVERPIIIRDNYWIIESDKPHVLVGDLMDFDTDLLCENPHPKESNTQYFELPKEKFRLLSRNELLKEYSNWWNNV